MRKHEYKELFTLSAQINDTGNDKPIGMTTGREVSKRVESHLQYLAKEVLDNLVKRLPEGMTVAVTFTLLPEHDEELRKCK